MQMAARSWIASAVPAVMLIGAVATSCGGGGSTGTAASQATAGATTTGPNVDLAAKAKQLIPIASQSQAVASKKESLRIANAQGELLLIAQKDPAAIAPLT